MVATVYVISLAPFSRNRHIAVTRGRGEVKKSAIFPACGHPNGLHGTGTHILPNHKLLFQRDVEISEKENSRPLGFL